MGTQLDGIGESQVTHAQSGSPPRGPSAFLDHHQFS